MLFPHTNVKQKDGRKQKHLKFVLTFGSGNGTICQLLNVTVHDKVLEIILTGLFLCIISSHVISVLLQLPDHSACLVLE